MLGEVPLGVTGVVAAEVPVEALRPLPANRCTHNIPLTGSSPEETKAPAVVEVPNDNPVNAEVPLP